MDSVTDPLNNCSLDFMYFFMGLRYFTYALHLAFLRKEKHDNRHTVWSPTEYSPGEQVTVSLEFVFGQASPAGQGVQLVWRPTE